MAGSPALSIVIAVEDGAANVPAWLDAVNAVGCDVEVLFGCAGSIPDQLSCASVTAFSCPRTALVPLLWSEGILRARGNAVALTTSQFVPDPRWLARLAKVDLKRWVGVGGAIDNDPQSSPMNWAVFFLRYSAFMPPLRAGETDEIAADNAVYDRAAVLAHPDLLADGFWEPSFHRRFRAAGAKLALDPELLVIYRGTLTPRDFAWRRYLHGRAYGIERAERAGLARNAGLLLSSPFVTPLLLARTLSRISRRSHYRTSLARALPLLARFTLAWNVGEASGYALVLAKRIQGGVSRFGRRHAQ